MTVKYAEENGIYSINCTEAVWSTDQIHAYYQDAEHKYGEIGFLKDYRRMNVAITRSKEQLIVIGDSATIGADKFYNEFLSYVEKFGDYRTVWEFEM